MTTGGTVTGADPPGGEARRPGNAAGRFRLALTLNLLAVAVALLVGLWFLSYQRMTLAYPQFSSNFYDAQARSWLRGRWAIPPRVLGLEGIRSDTGMQMYFGPFPSLFRLPVVLFTRRLDGRLSQPSLFLAYATYLAAISWIWWQVRAMFRAGQPIGRGDAILSAATILTLGVGTLFVTLLTSTTVYFEAIAWGVALTLLCIACLMSCLRNHRLSTSVGAIIASAAALQSRVSVGIGALAAVWGVCIVWVVALLVTMRSTSTTDRLGRITRSLAPTLSVRSASMGRCLGWLGGAIAATTTYVVVNHARFGTLFSVPWSRYVYNEASSQRLAALADNDGTLVGARYAPTMLWNYLRPDGVSLDRRIPWITFPRRGTTRIGDVVLDVTAPTASATATMPAILLLAGIGLFVLFRRRRSELGAVRIPVLGASVGGVSIFLVGFSAHRYMADMLPLLVVASIVGLHWLRQRLRTDNGRRTRISVATGVALLACWGIASNLALSVETQNLIWPRSEEVRLAFIERRHSAGDAPIKTVETVPPAGELGEIVALGNCDALLWSTGTRWMVIEGVAPASSWTVEPWMRPFDEPVLDLGTGRPPTLCRKLTNNGSDVADAVTQIAPGVGLEPTANGLTVRRSAN